MPKKGHRIAPEVKADILRRIKDEGITVQQAAVDHGIHETTIYAWLTKGAEGAPTLGELVRLKKENQALLKLAGELSLKLSATQKRG